MFACENKVFDFGRFRSRSWQHSKLYGLQAVKQSTVYPILFAISFCHLLNDMNQSLLTAIYPILKTSFHLNFSQIGLITLTFQVTASLLQPVVGIYTDKRSTPYSLVAGMGITLLGLLFLSVAPGYAALLMAAVGIGLAGIISNPFIVMALLCFAQIGVSAVPPMFWPLPASFLTGASAAAGIAAINSLGNLSGFAGPYAMGYLKDFTGSFTAGLLLLAGIALLGAVIVILLRIDARREQVSGEVAMAH